MDTVLWLCRSLPTETLKWLSSLPILMQESFWWWQCSDRYIISLSPHLHTSSSPFSPSLIILMVSVDVKHHVYLLTCSIATSHSSGAVWKSRWSSWAVRLTSLLVFVDVKNYWTVLRHWSQLVPNMSTDIVPLNMVFMTITSLPPSSSLWKWF